MYVQSLHNPDMLVYQTQHTEGNIFGIAVRTGVEEDDQGNAVSCTCPKSAGTLEESSVQVPLVIGTSGAHRCCGKCMDTLPWKTRGCLDENRLRSGHPAAEVDVAHRENLKCA